LGEGSVFVLRLRRLAGKENVAGELPVAKPESLQKAGQSASAAAGMGVRTHG